jgi:hypothetical protein
VQRDHRLDDALPSLALQLGAAFLPVWAGFHLDEHNSSLDP